MSEWFTVQFAQPTGYTDRNGNVSYNVKFEGIMDGALWNINPNKTTIQDGMKVYGHIDEIPTKKDPSKTYRKFVREQPDEPGQTSSIQKKTYSAKQVEKTDSIVQGRCYNNAATIVSAMIINGVTEPDVNMIANTIQEIAERLYTLPPLEKTAPAASPQATDTVYEPDDQQAIDLSAVDNMFPGHVPLDVKRK